MPPVLPVDLAPRIATAPISWGVCEVPGWGHQLSVDRVLGEMSDLGFTLTELGSAGWLPSEATPLQATLDANDLSLLGAFIPLVLHDADQAEKAAAQAADAAALLSAVGAPYFVTAPVTSDDWEPRRPLSDAEWAQLYLGIEEIEKLCTEQGLIQVVHEHVGCVIETRDEVERLLDNTSARIVLDTGHLALGGYDPLEAAETRRDRVGLVHLKDLRLDVAERLNSAELTLMEAVQAGLFPSLGQGDLPIAEVVRVLEETGYDGHYVIEQDCAITGAEPAPGEGPATDVAQSVDYLRTAVGALF
ncbi:MAG: sugar phosphate isomerase/epimerase [Actinomycetota bacterium]